MKFFHIYSNEKNIGDWASAEGIKKFLVEAVGKDIEFENYFAIRDLDKNKIKRINNEFDVVILGGGGLLRDSGWDWRRFIINISRKSLDEIKIPIIGYAIGINYEEKMTKRIKDIADYIQEKFSLVSVRDTASKKMIAKADLTKCPSMLLKNPIIKKYSNNVGIVPIPLKRLRNQQEYVFQMRKFIMACLKKGKNVNIITQAKFPEDACYELAKGLPVNLFLPSNPWIAMEYYSQMDIVVGSRGHSLIFSAGQIIPFINLSYNVKCDEFCKEIDYPINLNLDANNFTAEDIIKAYQFIVNQKDELEKKMEKAREKTYVENLKFSKKIIDFLTAKLNNFG